MKEFLGIFGFLESCIILYLFIRLFHHKLMDNSKTNMFDFWFFTIISFILSICVKIVLVVYHCTK